MNSLAETQSRPIALITGASSGVGRAIAVHLAQLGYTPIIHYYQNIDGALETARLVQHYCAEERIIQANLCEQQGIDELNIFFHETRDDERLALVVHTLGDFLSKPLIETSLTEWQRILDTNVTSTLLLTKKLLPMMRTRKGQFIFFGAAYAQEAQARPRTTLYTSAKAMLVAITRQLALDHAQDGVSFSCISPTVLENSAHSLATPTQTTVHYDDVLLAIDFLITSPRSAINGTNLTLSDGWLPQMR